MVRAAPPGIASASNTSTRNPARASTIAAASPLGPEPMTQALPFALPGVERCTIRNFSPPDGDFSRSVVRMYQPSQHVPHSYSLGGAAGHSTTLILPSASRCRVGAYRPKYSLFHHVPVARFSEKVVNQYCQSTARICFGGSRENGFPAKSERTSLLFESSFISVSGTIGD